MTTINRADKISVSAYGDGQIKYNAGGTYNRFKNTFNTPLVNVKGIQLLNCNFVNSSLQLNDDNGELIFWYYSATQPEEIISINNLRCVRLFPSWFHPMSNAFTTFVKNKYFSNVSELVAALNLAASTGGDNINFNPRWAANRITFSYDTTTRKISIVPASGYFITPCAIDDPNVKLLNETPDQYLSTPSLPVPGTGGTPALCPKQFWSPLTSMGSRLGWGAGFNSHSRLWNGASQRGVITIAGQPVPQPDDTGIGEAPSSPILLGTQNVFVYCNQIGSSGQEGTTQKRNLIAQIPINVAPLNIQEYTLSSVEKPALSVSDQFQEIEIELLDDFGAPFIQPASYNSTFTFSVYY